MTESERAALDTIRRVVDSVIGESAIPDTLPVEINSLTLPVPYLSQFGQGADEFTNDSGAAAGAMLVGAYTGKKLTPSDFFHSSSTIADAPLSFPQISETLGKLGVSAELRIALKLADLALVLFSGRPAIIHIDHDLLHQAGLTPETFDGPHFVTVVGMDLRHAYIHDPLLENVSGQAKVIPWVPFFQAWKKGDGNVRTMLVPRQQLIRRVRVTATSLNVYRQPGVKAAPVGTVGSGEMFEITVRSNWWGKIGEDRWINLNYTTDI